jgi:hypothetical protein
MNRQLVEIVAQYAICLEQAAESAFELETIVRHQEDLASKLQWLTLDERRQFIALLSEIANGRPASEEYVRQIDRGMVSNPFGRAEANLSRMRQGLPPLGPDGSPVPLHQIRPLSRGGTNEAQNLVPSNQTTHQPHTKLLHDEPFLGEQYHLGRR